MSHWRDASGTRTRSERETMSEESDAPVDREELEDRLIARGLREVVGGEAPPQLTQRIMAAATAAAPTTLTTSRAMSTPPQKGFRWGAFAIAVCLMIGATILLVPLHQAPREAARRGSTMQDAGRKATATHDARKPAPADGEKSELGDSLPATAPTNEAEPVADASWGSPPAPTYELR